MMHSGLLPSLTAAFCTLISCCRLVATLGQFRHRFTDYLKPTLSRISPVKDLIFAAIQILLYFGHSKFERNYIFWFRCFRAFGYVPEMSFPKRLFPKTAVSRPIKKNLPSHQILWLVDSRSFCVATFLRTVFLGWYRTKPPVNDSS